MCFFQITKRVFRPKISVFGPNYDRLSKPGPNVSYRAILKKSTILTTFMWGFPVKRSISSEALNRKITPDTWFSTQNHIFCIKKL